MKRDIRLAVDLFTHPKWLRLERALGARGCLGLLRLWTFAACHRPDGVLRGLDAADIASAARWRGVSTKFVDDLLATGWLDSDRGDVGGNSLVAPTYRLHDWQVHQPWITGSERRSNAASTGALAKHAKTKKSGLRISAEQNEPQKSAYAPSPSPSPSPTTSEVGASDQPTKERKTKDPHPEAAPLADYLESAIRSHMPNARTAPDKWARDIDLALRIDGRTPDELRAVIDFAHKNPNAWSGWKTNLLSGLKLREKFDQINGQRLEKRTAGSVEERRAALPKDRGYTP